MTDGYRVIRELEEAIAMLIFFFSFLIVLSILTCQLSSVGCKTLVRAVKTCLAQPLGSDPSFGCPCAECTGCDSHLEVSSCAWTKSMASFLPSYSRRKVSSAPPTSNQLRGAACILQQHFYTGKSTKFSKP